MWLTVSPPCGEGMPAVRRIHSASARGEYPSRGRRRPAPSARRRACPATSRMERRARRGRPRERRSPTGWCRRRPRPAGIDLAQRRPAELEDRVPPEAGVLDGAALAVSLGVQGALLEGEQLTLERGHPRASARCCPGRSRRSQVVRRGAPFRQAGNGLLGVHQLLHHRADHALGLGVEPAGDASVDGCRLRRLFAAPARVLDGRRQVRRAGLDDARAAAAGRVIAKCSAFGYCSPLKPPAPRASCSSLTW